MQHLKAMTTEEQIGRFALQTIEAIQLMYSNAYLGQMFVLIHSAVDSMGLLDAPPAQVEADGASFQAWVKKYLLPQNASFEFNEVDFWAARCGVLHTFTSHSRLASNGKAKQIQYYSGDKASPMATAFVTTTRQLDNGAHVPAHLEDVYVAFCKGVQAFVVELEKNCKANPAYEQRMRNILQQYQLPGQ